MSNSLFERSVFNKLSMTNPFYFFVPKNDNGREEYNRGFRIDELMQTQTMGFVTANDKLNISFTEQEQSEKIHDLLEMSEDSWRIKYGRAKDARDWTYLTAKKDAESFSNKVQQVSYRPFDIRFTYYTGNSRGLYSSPQSSIMRHLQNPNVALCCIRINSRDEETYFVSNRITDKTILSSKDNANVFPLYLYSDDGTIRKPNFKGEILKNIETALGETVEPEALFDYIYAVLHSPAYRAKYKEFLKIDFPRIPYPTSAEEYHRLSGLGSQLRKLHLMEEVPAAMHAQFNTAGSNIVDKPEYKGGNVWINKEQCFEDVPETAWNFYIGGYQPAQKWLKDRKGRELTFDDIAHYRKIITVLIETDRWMKEIDNPTND